MSKLLLGTVVWVWMLGFMVFEWQISVLHPHLAPSCDAIVVFTGSSGRMKTGISLLKMGHAPLLLISGVKSDRIDVLSREEHSLPITLGYDAKNTVENVQETVTWINAKKARTVYLVTADYHILRSLLLLRIYLPDVVFVPYPVKTEWKTRLKHSFVEYHKYIASWILYARAHT